MNVFVCLQFALMKIDANFLGFFGERRENMANLSPQLIDDIRQKVNIVDVVGEYVQLKKSGRNYSGLCPFHEEKSPSFSVTEEKQIFKCFGCGKGGNVFTFLQDIEGISFPEAVKKVADMVHVPLEISASQPASPALKKKQTYLKMQEKTREVYQHLLLNTKVGEEAFTYLTERGLDEETLKQFALGYAPDTGNFLVEILKKEGFSEDDLLASGLFVSLEDGQLKDRFKNRIMFPLENPQGELVGFSGRLVGTRGKENHQPKYLNSPETGLFEKRQLLYHFSEAKGEIRKAGQCFLLEGFMDVIAAFQGGIKNAVASMGTSFTQQQTHLLEKVTPELVLCYDGDLPGQNAIFKSLEQLKTLSQLRLKIVMLPEKLDPDEYLRKYGVESFQNFLTKEQKTAFQFKEVYLKNHYDLTNEQGLGDYLKELVLEIATIPSLMERDILLGQTAEKYHVTYDILKQQLTGFTKEKQAAQLQKIVQLNQAVKPQQEKISRVEKAERQLLYRFFYEEDLRLFLRQQPEVIFEKEGYQELYLLMDGYAQAGGVMEENAFLDFLQKDPAMQNVATTIFMLETSPAGTEEEVMDLLTVLTKGSLERKITEKRQLQKEAHRLGNKDLELQLTLEIIQLTQQLKIKGIM